jgi:phosphatidylglycerol:prolipoprotein diacylglycerol transferase
MRQTLVRISFEHPWSLAPVDGITGIGAGYLWLLFAIVWTGLQIKQHGWKFQPQYTIPIVCWTITLVGIHLLSAFELLTFRIGEAQVSVAWVPVFGYGFMLFMGFLAASWAGTRRAIKAGLDGGIVYDVAMMILFAGIIGARIFYCIKYPERVFGGKHGLGELFIAAINLTQGGLVFYGGMILGTVAYFVFCKKKSINPLLLADVIVPAIFVGLAFGRIGCFLNGCCFGDLCAQGWAVQFPQGSVPYQALLQRGLIEPGAAFSPGLHPSQLYSSLNAFVLAAVTAFYTKYKTRNGAVLALGWLLYPITRYGLEILRSDELNVIVSLKAFLFWGPEIANFQSPFTISQWISIGLLTSGIIFTFWLSKRPISSVAGQENVQNPAVPQKKISA